MFLWAIVGLSVFVVVLFYFIFRSDWDRWLVMGIIGIVVGVLGFLSHQIIDYLIQLKWELVENYIQVK